MKQSSNIEHINRLLGLFKCWGAIKVFHPYLAYRTDLDWDAALVSAIPKVYAAHNAREYAAAVQEMLSILGDLVTRVVHPEHLAPIPPPHETQPSFEFTSDEILVVKINYYQDIFDINSASQRLAAIQTEIPKACAILFDLRAAAPVSPGLGDLSFAFRLSEITALLSTTPLVTAGERSRMHIGLVPQISSMGFPYTSAFQVTDGCTIMPASEAHDLPIVFLINAWSELPPEALALQIGGKAAILVEGSASDISLGIDTHSVTLSDGIKVKFRLNEIVNADGSAGLLPDLVIPPPQSPEEGDIAYTVALALLRDFKPNKVNRNPLPVHAAHLPEKAYPEMVLPPLEYRLLAACRIWTAIHYFFPYKDLIEEDWNDVLREFIPKMEQANTALRYHLVVAEMVTHTHDSHSTVFSPVLDQHFGNAYPPVRLQIIENIPVVTAILDEALANASGVRQGDVVLTIEGQDAMERITECARYIPASTSQSLMHRAAQASLSGREDSFVSFIVHHQDRLPREVKLPRKAKFGHFLVSQRSGEVVMLLTEEIGYADLDRLEDSGVDEMFERLKNAKAIIFDMRGFPHGTAWSIAPRLSEVDGVKAALIQRPFLIGPDETELSTSYTILQPIPSTEKCRYKGKTVMLIDERAISQAEHTGLFFEAANGTKFIGSPTAGANGDITNLNVPGGIIITFTGQAIRHIDGRQLQRIGLIPDIGVCPTIAGLQSKRDEVLETAIEYLESELKDSHN
jgi:C-terminal processing protease CtpA/Prc